MFFSTSFLWNKIQVLISLIENNVTLICFKVSFTFLKFWDFRCGRLSLRCYFFGQIRNVGFNVKGSLTFSRNLHNGGLRIVFQEKAVQHLKELDGDNSVSDIPTQSFEPLCKYLKYSFLSEEMENKSIAYMFVQCRWFFFNSEQNAVTRKYEIQIDHWQIFSSFNHFFHQFKRVAFNLQLVNN